MERAELERYARQIILKEVGGPGQAAIGQSKVLVVGAGGLGGPAALYLAAAGVGTLGLVDDDVVDLSNLHRQIQFLTDDLSKLKVDVLGNKLCALNPHIDIKRHNVRLDQSNAVNIIAEYDIVLDGTDSFETRFAVNAACLTARKPLVSGALGRFDGQLAVFKNDGSGPCYQCFVPQAPPDAETCASVGILGALAGIIGSMMAMETLKIVTGAGRPLSGRLFLYDGLNGETRTVSLPQDPSCPACSKS
ncbi:MAG: molybdopterin-synthase adenylyltransferase MoeB [Acidimicrobiales bacterium]|nr:molybdopterin-synthase adenylyltransferase MoeB [Hyphomonadaceae bacterium]RZV44732.1 MAG: molybdopterin-synthase adenylyltransferase MoeB [Acidimicrobiales bacterium]